MEVRFLKKATDAVYNAATKGDFKSACKKLQMTHSTGQHEILDTFTKQTSKKPGNSRQILKDLAKAPANIGKYVKSKFNLQKTTKTPKNIPDEYKTLLANLEGKSGKEFIDTAYKNTVEYMNLKGIAPDNIAIKGEDGIMSITGGYNPIDNTIEYSKGFQEKLAPERQINLISHELKHCEQFTNMLRTEGIGVNKYVRAMVENDVKNAIKDTSFTNFMFRMQYERALKNGQGEEFIQKAIDSLTESYIAKVESSFSNVLKMPKIKTNSPEGIKALKDLEAKRNYEGLNFLGFGSESYENNPLEVEAYAFGNSIEKLFKDFVS